MFDQIYSQQSGIEELPVHDRSSAGMSLTVLFDDSMSSARTESKTW